MLRHIYFRIACLLLLLFANLQLSYNFNQAWWHSAAGTAVLFVLGWMIWHKHFLQVSRLRMPVSQLKWVLLSTIACTLLFAWIMSGIAATAGVRINLSALPHYVHSFFYILNEEVIMGALMLHFMTRRFRLSHLASSALLAAVLAVAHLVLYRFYFRDKDMLLFSTVLTLFFALFAKNNLILRFHHIGYAWALHFGWMSVMYGSYHFYTATGQTLRDIEKFNLYLGSWPVLFSALIFAGLTMLIGQKPQSAQRFAHPLAQAPPAGRRAGRPQS